MLFNRILIFHNNRFHYYLHSALPFEFFLVIWTLATGIFPYYFKFFTAFTYWWMGIAGAFGLLLSVVFHQLICTQLKSVLGLRCRDITFFLFSGVEEITEKDECVAEEMVIGFCSILLYLVMAFLMQGLVIIGQSLIFPLEVLGVIEFVRMANIVIAIVNIVPIIPSDGVLILMGILKLFNIKLNEVRRLLTELAIIIGLILIAAGMLIGVKGNLQGGVWWILWGEYFRECGFLIKRKSIIKKNLQKDTARSVMSTDPVFVKPETRVDVFIEKYLYRHHFKMYPVVNSQGVICGMVFPQTVFKLSQSEWCETTIADIAVKQIQDVVVHEDMDVLSIITKMYQTSQSRMSVVDKEQRLLGIIVLKDIMKYLTIKMNGQKNH